MGLLQREAFARDRLASEWRGGVTMAAEIKSLVDVADDLADIRTKAYALDCAIRGAGANPKDDSNALEWLAAEVADGLRRLSDAIEKKLEAERATAE